MLSRGMISRLARMQLHQIVFKRTLLSQNYACESEWQKRLENDTLKHISTERYFFELNQRYQQREKVSAVDIDIFVNSLHRLESQAELEHMVKKLRSTPLTVSTLDSTHHAVCRFYLTHGKRDYLLNILNRRVEFGIFPDTFIYNILLGQSLTEKNLENAFGVVKLMMLQEDSGNQISKILALHTLNQVLLEGLIEAKLEEPKEEVAEEDDEEIEYIRVPYLTNPYFDDHFDLTKREHIFGKSLYFFGYEFGLEKDLSVNDQVLARSAQILGLIFYQKWEKLQNTLNRFCGEDTLKVVVTKEPLEYAKKHLEVFQGDEAMRTQLEKVIARIESSNQEMKTLIEPHLAQLPNLEKHDIEAIKSMFNEFEQTRVKTLHAQMEALLAEQRRQELEAKQKELAEKKRLYYFFENFPKHEIDFVEAEKRISEMQATTEVEEDYIPPEKY